MEELVLLVSLVSNLLFLELHCGLHLGGLRLGLLEFVSEDPHLVLAGARLIRCIDHLFHELCILLPHFF